PGRLDPATARAIWNVAPTDCLDGEFPVTESELAALNELLDPPLRLEPGVVMFIGLHRDHPGEVIVEPDGRRWYPAPGIDAPFDATDGLRSSTPKTPQD